MFRTVPSRYKMQFYAGTRNRTKREAGKEFTEVDLLGDGFKLSSITPPQGTSYEYESSTETINGRQFGSVNMNLLEGNVRHISRFTRWSMELLLGLGRYR